LISAFKFIQISSVSKNIQPIGNNNNNNNNNVIRPSTQSSALKLALSTSIQKRLLWLPNIILNLFKFTKRSLSGQVLRDGIAKFYDESSQIWLDVWGEHMHHGYYEPKNPTSDHKQAQIEMIDRAVDWAYGKDLATANPTSTVDVGCGVGGSSRHIVKRFNMKEGRGLSLSPFQIKKANEFTNAAGLSDRVQYLVDDALNMPFSNGKFDLSKFLK